MKKVLLLLLIFVFTGICSAQDNWSPFDFFTSHKQGTTPIPFVDTISNYADTTFPLTPYTTAYMDFNRNGTYAQYGKIAYSNCWDFDRNLDSTYIAIPVKLKLPVVTGEYRFALGFWEAYNGYGWALYHHSLKFTLQWWDNVGGVHILNTKNVTDSLWHTLSIYFRHTDSTYSLYLDDTLQQTASNLKPMRTVFDEYGDYRYTVCIGNFIAFNSTTAIPGAALSAYPWIGSICGLRANFFKNGNDSARIIPMTEGTGKYSSDIGGVVPCSLLTGKSMSFITNKVDSIIQANNLLCNYTHLDRSYPNNTNATDNPETWYQVQWGIGDAPDSCTPVWNYGALKTGYVSRISKMGTDSTNGTMFWDGVNNIWGESFMLGGGIWKDTKRKKTWICGVGVIGNANTVYPSTAYSYTHKGNIISGMILFDSLGNTDTMQGGAKWQGGPPIVRMACGYGNSLIVGGYFGDVLNGTLTVNHIARWDTAGWHTMPTSLGGTGVNTSYVWFGVTDTTQTPNICYITGGFTLPGQYIMTWNGTVLSPMGAGIPGAGVGLTYDNNYVYASGGAGAVWRWKKADSTWTNVSITTSSEIWRITIYKGVLYALGTNLWKSTNSGVNWTSVLTMTGWAGGGLDMTIYNNILYVVGSFVWVTKDGVRRVCPGGFAFDGTHHSRIWQQPGLRPEFITTNYRWAKPIIIGGDPYSWDGIMTNNIFFYIP